MPITRRTQEHPFRHVLPPKFHRPAGDEMLNSIVCSTRGDGKSKWTGADD
jgi:hypothetical protein